MVNYIIFVLSLTNIIDTTGIQLFRKNVTLKKSQLNIYLKDAYIHLYKEFKRTENQSNYFLNNPNEIMICYSSLYILKNNFYHAYSQYILIRNHYRSSNAKLFVKGNILFTLLFFDYMFCYWLLYYVYIGGVFFLFQSYYITCIVWCSLAEFTYSKRVFKTIFELLLWCVVILQLFNADVIPPTIVLW